MHNPPLVYLAGPISGLSFDEAAGWRKDVTRRLRYANIYTLNPLRVVEPFKVGEFDNQGTEEKVVSMKGMIDRDRFDIMAADLVLFNLNTSPVSVGSMIELGWADAFRKPIIVINDAAFPHAFIKGLASYIVPNIDKAIDIIKTILSNRFEPVLNAAFLE